MGRATAETEILTWDSYFTKPGETKEVYINVKTNKQAEWWLNTSLQI